MNLILLVPRVIKSFIANFPEVTNNAYKYFNFDHRVVDERVQRFDSKPPYRGPNALTDMDYGSLLSFAKASINPILAKYSMNVACEDALHMAIRSFANGMYDNKINASRFVSLLGELKKGFGMTPSNVENYRHSKKKKKDMEVRPHVLKQLDLKPEDIPHKKPVVTPKGVPYLVREKGKIVRKDFEK
jgi:hypothetical protein